MAQSTISQRIALEGAEDILKQLADLGQAGEKAVKQIQDASAAMSTPGLANLSAVAETVRAAFGRVGESLVPVRTAFSELGEAAHEVGTRLTEVASIFGVGLVAGVAGGLAGIFELIKASAESAHRLEVQSEVLGISILDLKTFGAAAANAGVDSDKLNTALTRFQQNVGKQNEQLFQDSIKLLQMLPAAASQAGVAVVEGIKPAGAAVKSHIIGNITDSLPLINTAIDQIRAQLSEHGIALPDTFFQGVRQNLLNVAGDATKSAETIRLALAQFGVNLPAQTVFEQLAAGAQRAKNPLLELGITVGDLQKLNVTETILKAADALEKMGPTTERARLSLALFGRTWPEVLKALRDGSDGFERLREKVAANNPDLDANVGKLSESEKALIGLQLAGKNLRDQLSAVFAPAITSAAEGFTQLIKDNVGTFKAWASVISDLILPGIKNLTGQLGETGKAAAHSLPDVISGKTGSGVARPASASPEVFGPPAPVDISPLEKAAAALDKAQTSLQKFMTGLRELGQTLAGPLKIIQTALDGIAFAINAVFGTNLNEAGAAAVLVVGRLVGAFTLLDKAIRAVLSVEGALFRILGLGALTGPVGLSINGLILLGAALVIYHDKITQFLSDTQQALGAFLQSNIGDRINALFANVNFEPFRLAVIGALASAGKALDDFLGIFDIFFTQTLPDLVSRVISSLNPLFSALASLGKKLLGAAGAGADEALNPDTGNIFLDPTPSGVKSSGGLGVDSGPGDFSSAEPGSGFALGGHITRGPAGIDKIPAMLTLGEFVMSASAVRHYGSDFLHAINSMRLPFEKLQGFSLGGLVGSIADSFAPAPLMLAAGGHVLGAAAGGPMNSLTLNLSGESFALDVAPGHVYDKLARHARSSAIRSAGRKPSWFTG